jgi:hypothetical protein
MSSVSPSPQSRPTAESRKKSVLDVLAAIVGGISAVVRKAPVAVAFVVIAAVLYFRQSNQPEEHFPEFNDPAELQKEPTPPPELSQETASVWTCVHRSDAQLSNGLWADIYYGMEVRLDGKMLTVKVTEKWKELSEDKRKTVANLVVETWVENSQMLHLLNSRDEMEEVVIKRLPEDVTVANWKPATGVQLFEPEAGA